MAGVGTLSALRTGAARLLAGGGQLPGAISTRSIVHKTRLVLPEDYPEPWDYKNKGYDYRHALEDDTQRRFTENSKLIVIEGNIGSGKTRLAKELANELGFHHMPEFKMDDILIDRYGNDLRHYYHLLPKSFRIPDVNMFYKNPMDENTARMQHRIFQCRHEQYLNALAHILNTGQGVVLERSPHTDFVFTNAMRSKKYISPEYFKFYYYQRKAALPHLHFWPHVIIYLDTPVKTCLQNIRKRGNVAEIDVVDEAYLSVIAESYKDALGELKRHSKVLAFDWTTPGDVDSVVEELEATDTDYIDRFSKEYGLVFHEWNTMHPNSYFDEITWNGWRRYVTYKFDARAHSFVGLRTHEVGELYINPRDAAHAMLTIFKHVLKENKTYGFKKSDPRGGMHHWNLVNQLPETWYEYYWREAYLTDYNAMEMWADTQGDSLDPDYVHDHHHGDEHGHGDGKEAHAHH